MKAVFVGGCGRSGTTLLGSQLGTHHDVLATPESKFIINVWRKLGSETHAVNPTRAIEELVRDPTFRVWGISLDPSFAQPSLTYADLIRRAVLAYGRREGKNEPSLWVDHTPRNIAFPATLATLFPDSKLIHIVRDGRAVTASVLPLDWGPNTVSAAAKWWTARVGRGLAAEVCFGSERALRVDFESLVHEPEPTLRNVCEFLKIDYDPRMLSGHGFAVPSYTAKQHRLVGQPPDPKRAEAWRELLSAREVEVFESIAGEVLSCLGYSPEFELRPNRRTLTEAIRDELYERYRRRMNSFGQRRRLRDAIIK